MTHRLGLPSPPGTIQAAKRRLARQLFNERAIAGVGIVRSTTGRAVLRVYLANDAPATRALVPAEIDGYPITVEVVGLITRRASPLVS